MPKPANTPFLGIAYSLRSESLADQRLINLYPEIVEGKSGSAEVGGFYGCPGLDLVTNIGDGPIRALRACNGALYAISGSQVYSLDSAYTASLLGSLNNSAGPVSIVNNSTQVGFFDGVGGFSYSASAYAPITLPLTNAPGLAAYVDGFVVLMEQGTQNIWQSNLNDLTTWDALNYGVENGSADNVVSIIEFHNQITVLKQGFICFYINAGNPGFVFQRLQGVYAEIGVVAPYSVCEIDEKLLWLGASEHGGPLIYMMPGYEPVRISTHAIEYAMDRYPTVSDALAFTYAQEGHRFYVITFPSANGGMGETWCLDLTATQKMGVPAWHQRAGFADGLFQRFAGNCFASFNGQLLVGDYASGNIYALDLATYTDNGAIRKWLRSWRASPANTYEPQRFNFLELNYQSGIIPAGLNPQFVLRYSDDGGFNWSAELYGAMGQTGQTGYNARWNRLGMTRRGVNSARIFELSGTDPVQTQLFGATIG